MKQFLLLILKSSLLLLLVLVLLDVVYTEIYLHSSKRGKIEEVFNSKAQTFDVVFLGSSRANNHFVAQLFQDKGLKSFNYGMSGGHLFEASLLLKLMMERKYTIKNIVLEADLNLVYEGKSDAISAKFLPFIHQSEIIKKHFSNEPDFLYNYYIPFYRYVAYDASIGYLEALHTLLHRETVHFKNFGFLALAREPNANMKNDLRPLKAHRNAYYETIKNICKSNHINLITVMTPMCENTKGLEYFKNINTVYPEIHNYENVVEGDEYFSSCGHLNGKGASIFTTRILKDFFNK
jgi:hypothetical protein